MVVGFLVHAADKDRQRLPKYTLARTRVITSKGENFGKFHILKSLRMSQILFVHLNILYLEKCLTRKMSRSHFG